MSQDRQPTLFVSHPSTKADVATHVERALNARGIRCWIAPRDIEPGDQWDVAIRKAIGATDAILLLFCTDSDRSKQVKRELILADNAGKPIIPMRLERIEPDELSYHLADSQWIDWIEQRDDAIDRIAAKAREFHGTPGAASTLPPLPPQPAPSEPRPGSTGNFPYLIAGGVLALLIGFAIWWFALRSPAPQAPAATAAAPPTATPAPSQPLAAPAPGTAEPVAPPPPGEDDTPVTAEWFAGVWGMEMPCRRHFRFDRSGALTDPDGVSGRWEIADGVLTQTIDGATHRMPLTKVNEDEVSSSSGPIYRCFAGAT